MNEKYFILIANEKYGNTDWINHINNVNLNSNYHSIFLGKGTRSGKKFYANREILSDNTIILFFKLIKLLFKIRGHKTILVIRFFKLNLLYNFTCKIILQKNYRIFLDIRSVYVGSFTFNYFFTNFLMKLSSLFYDYTYIINSLLIHKIGIRNAIVLPIGIDNRVFKLNKKINSFKFIYLGTLNREGLLNFFKLFCETVIIYKLNYNLTIYTEDNIENYLQIFKKYPSIIKYSGALQRNNLFEEIYKYDIGISPIPLNSIYDLQPHTKLFEYLQCGLPHITKNTSGVKNQFNNFDVGWYYNDESDIVNILTKEINIENYNKKLVQIKKININSWENIYKNKIHPFLI
jgi:hypothetical protein